MHNCYRFYRSYFFLSDLCGDRESHLRAEIWLKKIIFRKNLYLAHFWEVWQKVLRNILNSRFFFKEKHMDMYTQGLNWNGLRLLQGRFRLDIMNKFFMESIVKHWTCFLLPFIPSNKLWSSPSCPLPSFIYFFGLQLKWASVATGICCETLLINICKTDLLVSYP